MIKIKNIIVLFLIVFSSVSADDEKRFSAYDKDNNKLNDKTKIKLDLFEKYMNGEEIKPLHPVEKTLTQLVKQLKIIKNGNLRTGLVIGNCEEDCFGAVPFEFTLKLPEKGNFQVTRLPEGLFPHPDKLMIVSDFGTARLRFQWTDKEKIIDQKMFEYKKCSKDQYKYFGNTYTDSECRIAFFPIGDPLKNLSASISIIEIKEGGKELKSLIESMQVTPVFKRGLYQ